MKAWRCAFSVEGLNLERFVRRAGEAQIHLSSLKRKNRRLTGSVREKDVPALEELAGQGGWQFEAGRRMGIGHAAELIRSRWLLASGVLLAMICFLLATQVMWRIEIIDGGIYEPDIRLALMDMGVKCPMPKRCIKPGEIRDHLEWRYPSVAWMECGWRGMTLTIRVVEGMIPEKEVQTGACDVIASQAGIVMNVVTRAGTPVVKPGDLVQAGQLLIRGEERTAGGELRPVAARGTVNARVWISAAVETPLYGTQTAYTDREQTVWTIRCPWFDLWPMQESVFGRQDIAVSETPLCTWGIPFAVHTERRMEAEYKRERLDLEVLRQEGARAAMQKLTEKTHGGDSLVDKWINWSIINDEILLSVAVGEMIADVAQQSRLSGMAATDGP